MKSTKLLFAVTALVIAFSSCKKTDPSGTDEIETTFELSSNQAIADNLTEDANDVFMEAAADQELLGSKVSETLGSMKILGCATVNVTPLQGFPKNISIDFGAGCVSQNGIIRKGKINIVLSDSVRKTGSTAVLTFDGYYVNGFKKEGTITWTNNSTVNIKGWERKVENGKITAPGGKYWLHSGVKNVVQTAGYQTPYNLLDDVFSITGNHTVSNAAGATITSVITEALQKKTVCENIDKGKISIQAPNHTAVIDFGSGTCDKVATVSIDGTTPREFLLR